MTPPLRLHAESAPHAHGHLPTGDGHALYYEVCGNPHGTPLLYVHGGPGSGFARAVTQLMDPSVYTIVLMDQRGAGRSTPHGSITANTTPHLVADIERLRVHLGVDRWHVFGGSWGATLAIAYAMAHPGRVARMVLYGLFLVRDHELTALYGQDGVAAAMFPDVFAAFIQGLPPDTRDDPIAGYAALFESPDEAVRQAALRRWTHLEKAVSRLLPDAGALARDLEDADYVLAHSRIENHYFRHNGFIDADAILATAGQRLQGIPIDVVAARYDMVCPVQTAYDFVHAVPHARLTIVPDAGHTWRDPANTQALLAVLNAAQL